MNESNPDIQKMKEEAIRYVNEMRAKSKYNNSNNSRGRPNENMRGLNKAGANNLKNERTKDNKVHKDKDDKPKLEYKKRDPISDIFDIVMKDKEKTLILVLILILSSEGADTSLIFALMYLLI